MGYYKKARRFNCECGRAAMSVKEDVTKCQKCRMPNYFAKCKGCDKKFHSKLGKELCRSCNALQNNYKPGYLKLKTKRMLKNNCADHRVWAKDIKLLYVKMKHNLLSHIDLFRIASIFMEITCNEVKYSSLEPEEQCKSMINDLIKMVTEDDYEISDGHHRGRGVVRIDEKGRVIETFRSIREAAEYHDVYRGFVKNSCDKALEGKDKNGRLRFRWKNHI